MRCYRRILVVKWQDRRTNEEIRAVVQQKETVMDTIRMRKLQLFGHICRMPDDRLLKTLLFGMVAGERRPGRPARRLYWWHFEVVWQRSERCGINDRRENQIETIRDRLYGPCWPWDQKKKTKKKSPNEWRHQFMRNTCRQYCVNKRLIFFILFSLSARMMDAVIKMTHRFK